MMPAVVLKAAEANIAAPKKQTKKLQQKEHRRISLTALFGRAPRKSKRRMSSDALPMSLGLPLQRSPSPARSPSPSSSPSPIKENHRFPGRFGLRRKNGRKVSRGDKQIKIEQEKLRSWSSSFDCLLSDPVGIEIFHNFLKKEYSQENILFWKACQHFKSKITKDAELQQKAQEIFAEYISITPAAPNSVNIDHQTRTEVMEAIASPHRAMFKKAEEVIYTLMYRDKYCRFTQTPEFKSGLFPNDGLLSPE